MTRCEKEEQGCENIKSCPGEDGVAQGFDSSAHPKRAGKRAKPRFDRGHLAWRADGHGDGRDEAEPARSRSSPARQAASARRSLARSPGPAPRLPSSMLTLRVPER